MTKKIKTLLISLCLISLFLMPVLTLAASEMQDFLNRAAGAEGAGFDTAINEKTGLATIIGIITRIFISLLGIIFISYTIYGGYLWMTAGGNEERVTKAKDIIRNSIIGLLVILSAAAIYFFITNVLIGAGSGNVDAS